MENCASYISEQQKELKDMLEGRTFQKDGPMGPPRNRVAAHGFREYVKYDRDKMHGREMELFKASLPYK